LAFSFHLDRTATPSAVFTSLHFFFTQPFHDIFIFSFILSSTLASFPYFSFFAFHFFITPLFCAVQP